MSSFRDTTGRAWSFDVNVTTIKRVRSMLGVNLLDLASPEKSKDVSEQFEDPIFVVDVLYCLCKDQADAQAVSDEAFGEALDIDAIESASDALLEGVIDFFQKSIRPAYRKVLDATRRVRLKQQKRLAELMSDPTFEATIDKEVERILGNGRSESSSDATNSLESPESNPDSTPSEP